MRMIEEIVGTMNTELDRILISLQRLTEEQIWQKLKSNMNSVGNLCVHLAGNEYQHFVSGIGQKPNIRERSFEFTTDGIYNKEELMNLLKNVRSESIRILEGLDNTDLKREATVYYSQEDWDRMKEREESDHKPYYTRRIEVLLFQVAEHYAYHTGQIILLTKLLQTSQEAITEYKH